MSLSVAVGHLSSGLGFERVNARGVAARIDTLMNELSARLKLDPQIFLSRIGGLAPLADETLVDEIARLAQESGARKLNWDEIRTSAWSTLRRRLEAWAPGDEQPIASLDEILCAMRGIGPAGCMGLDIDRVPLASWARIFLRVVAAARSTDVTADPIPSWLAAYSLVRLGGRAASRIGSELLLKAATRSETEFDELLAIAHEESLGEGMGHRAAIVVRIPGNSVTASWTQVPQAGIVLVVDKDQFVRDAPHELLASAFAEPPPLIVWEERTEAPDLQSQIAGAIETGRLKAQSVHLYPRAEGDMKSPNIVDPTGPDAVFRRLDP